MKKKLIAAGAASLAVAAMPVVGVFATGTANNNAFVDSLSVTINGACTIEDSTVGVYNDEDRSFSGTIPAGTFAELTSTQGNEAFTIHCNATSGTWTVNAKASNGGTLVGSENSTPIAAGNATSGTTSNWAIRSNVSGSSTPSSNPFINYRGITTSTEGETFLAGNVNSSAVGTTNVSFNPSYQVYVSPDQAADIYTGSVTYTVSYTQPQQP